MGTVISSLSDLPQLDGGLYSLEDLDLAAADQALWKVAQNSKEGDGQQGARSIVVWGPEAGLYFSLDNIFDEIACGFRSEGVACTDVHDFVGAALIRVGLSELLDDARSIAPWELSGGQKQRLLCAVLFSRNPESVIAANPLASVEAIDRPQLYDYVAASLVHGGGRMLFIGERTARDVQHLSTRPVHLRLAPVFSSLDSRQKPTREKHAKAFRERRRSADARWVIEVENAHMRYANGALGISIVRLRVRSHRLYGIVGPNGAGKSSLVRLLVSERLPAGAQFRFEGREIRRPVKELVSRGRLQVAFQDPWLHATGTILGSFLACVTSRKVLETFRLVEHLHEPLFALPPRALRLAVFLRATHSRAAVIILDETLTGEILDAYRVPIQIELHRCVALGSAVLVISHEEAWISDTCDETIAIEGGRILSQEGSMA